MKPVIDKEQLSDMRRKRILLTAAAVVVALTLLFCFVLSGLAERNVDISEGQHLLSSMEKRDPLVQEQIIRSADEEYRRTIAERDGEDPDAENADEEKQKKD